MLKGQPGRKESLKKWKIQILYLPSRIYFLLLVFWVFLSSHERKGDDFFGMIPMTENWGCSPCFHHSGPCSTAGFFRQITSEMTICIKFISTTNTGFWWFFVQKCFSIVCSGVSNVFFHGCLLKKNVKTSKPLLLSCLSNNQAFWVIKKQSKTSRKHPKKTAHKFFVC